MSVNAQRPWYTHFYLWLVIIIPAVAVFFSLNFVYIAFTHQDPVVRDDWYQDGKAVNQSLDRSDKALAMGLQANVKVDAASGEVILHLDSKVPVTVPTLDMHFVHITIAERDQEIVLTKVADNDYRGHLVRPLDGSFNIELSTPAWRISNLRHLPDGEGFTLKAE